MIDFGDYVEIEQKCYGAANEMFVYKVVKGGVESNTYRRVPVDGNSPEPERGDMCPIIFAICCGVDETKVERFRVEDVRLLDKLSSRENKSFMPT